MSDRLSNQRAFEMEEPVKEEKTQKTPSQVVSSVAASRGIFPTKSIYYNTKKKETAKYDALIEVRDPTRPRNMPSNAPFAHHFQQKERCNYCDEIIVPGGMLVHCKTYHIAEYTKNAPLSCERCNLFVCYSNTALEKHQARCYQTVPGNLVAKDEQHPLLMVRCICPICAKSERTAYRLSAHVSNAHQKELKILVSGRDLYDKKIFGCSVCGVYYLNARRLSCHWAELERISSPCHGRLVIPAFGELEDYLAESADTVISTKRKATDELVLPFKRSRRDEVRNEALNGRDPSAANQATCMYCGILLLAELIENHTLTHHPKENRFFCKCCHNTSFPNYWQLKHHYKECSNGAIAVAQPTVAAKGEDTKEADAMSADIPMPQFDVPVDCPVCNKRCADFSSLDVHILLHKTDLPYFLCDGCDEAFPTARKLRTHVAVATMSARDVGSSTCVGKGRLMTVSESLTRKTKNDVARRRAIRSLRDTDRMQGFERRLHSRILSTVGQRTKNNTMSTRAQIPASFANPSPIAPQQLHRPLSEDTEEQMTKRFNTKQYCYYCKGLLLFSMFQVYTHETARHSGQLRSRYQCLGCQVVFGDPEALRSHFIKSYCERRDACWRFLPKLLRPNQRGEEDVMPSTSHATAEDPVLFENSYDTMKAQNKGEEK